MPSGWEVRFERAFTREFSQLSKVVQAQLVALGDILEEFGPDLGRPYVDRLKGSAYFNMKELRFEADGGVWRVAFAFDLESRAVLLVAGSKAGLWGREEDRFYADLIFTADTRFKAYLDRIKQDLKRRTVVENVTGGGGPYNRPRKAKEKRSTK
jgi:hypothetical protein